MLSKKVIKDIQLLSLKKQRQHSGIFIAEGPKIVAELLQLIPGQVQQIYATEPSGIDAVFHSKLTIVSEDELVKLSALTTPNKIIAVVKQLAIIEPEGRGWIIYLDMIQDPGNFGTIIRIADWFGVTSIVCSAGCADLYNPKVVQATMASIARVNVYYDEEGRWLQKQTLPIYAATLNGKDIYKVAKAENGIVVIGNESKGIRSSIFDLPVTRITIPGRGDAESLNAAVATGIILSHLMI